MEQNVDRVGTNTISEDYVATESTGVTYADLLRRTNIQWMRVKELLGQLGTAEQPIHNHLYKPPEKVVFHIGSGAFAIFGALIGIIVGYPLSYFFQSGALRAKMPIGAYVQHISDVFNSKELVGTAVGVWIASVVAFCLAGLLIGTMLKSQNNHG